MLTFSANRFSLVAGAGNLSRTGGWVLEGGLGDSIFSSIKVPESQSTLPESFENSAEPIHGLNVIKSKSCNSKLGRKQAVGLAEEAEYDRIWWNKAEFRSSAVQGKPPLFKQNRKNPMHEP